MVGRLFARLLNDRLPFLDDAKLHQALEIFGADSGVVSGLVRNLVEPGRPVRNRRNDGVVDRRLAQLLLQKVLRLLKKIRRGVEKVLNQRILYASVYAELVDIVWHAAGDSINQSIFLR